MLSVVVVVVSGSIAAWHYVGEWSNLVTTRYGITLRLGERGRRHAGARWPELEAAALRRGARSVPPTVWGLNSRARGWCLGAITGVLTETEHPRPQDVAADLVEDQLRPETSELPTFRSATPAAHLKVRGRPYYGPDTQAYREGVRPTDPRRA